MNDVILFCEFAIPFDRQIISNKAINFAQEQYTQFYNIEEDKGRTIKILILESIFHLKADF